MRYLILGIFLFAGVGYAHHDKSCTDDIKKYCKGIDPKDKDAILACLSQQESVLTKKCQKSHAKQFKKLNEAAVPSASPVPEASPAPSK